MKKAVRRRGDIRIWMLLSVMMTALPMRSFAWWSTGHMVVAEIAYRRLTVNAKTVVEKLLKINALPDSATFQTASVWADDLKRLDVHVFDNWHFVDLPFSTDGTALEEPGKTDNVEWAIKNCISILKSKRSPDSEKATMLKLLIHFVGDIHMPLHTTGRFTSALPHGDQGGNKFRLVGTYRNLHAYWDSGAGMYEDIPRPLTDSGNAKLKMLADEAESASPFDKTPLAANLNLVDWTKEGHELCRSFVYSTVESMEPTMMYKATAQKYCKEKVALAGYRLAAILNDIYK